MILVFEMFSNILLVALHSCGKSSHICPVLLAGLISALGTFQKKVVSSAYITHSMGDGGLSVLTKTNQNKGSDNVSPTLIEVFVEFVL